MGEWKPRWLTNRAMVASIVFQVNELATFEHAEGIADRVCEQFGILPDHPYVAPERHENA